MGANGVWHSLCTQFNYPASLEFHGFIAIIAPMQVVYVDASDCPRKVMGSFSSATSQILWIYVGAIFLVTPAAIVASSMSAATPLWIKIALTAAFAGALLLPFVALALQNRALKSSGLIVQPYGVTLRRILRSLASLRRSLDRSTGWSRRRIVAIAALVRLAAVAIAVASVASGPLTGLPKNVAGPLLLGGLALAAVLWIAVAGRLLRPKQMEARLLARTTLRRLAAVAVFLVVAFAYVSAFGLARTYWGDQPPWYIVIGLLFGGGAVGVAAYDYMSGVWARARTELHPVTADLRRWDKRRPVLLLRSFPDDAQNVQHETASTWDEETMESLEEAVGGRLGRYGPYIAVAEPSRGVSGGAARDRFQGEEWRAAVQNWMDEAVIIAMVAGWTEGVRWELEQAIARGHVEKLLLILPGGQHTAARWRQTCRSFSGTPWHADLLGIDTRFALAIHCTSQRVVVIASRARSARHYAAAAELAMFGMYCAEPAATA